MTREPQMTQEALMGLMQTIQRASLEIWLDGGWGVDALLGRQTREHRDVDIVIRTSDVPPLIDALGSLGFDVQDGQVPNAFVLGNGAGLRVDVHAVVFDEQGNGIYRMQDGEDWVYPAEGFEGRGIVGGLPVKCLSATTQVHCHAHGYEPAETDIHDMALLRERFGVKLPRHLTSQMS
jgi:lincosamide nucleotidyltransferase A/C/D/E